MFVKLKLKLLASWNVSKSDHLCHDLGVTK